MKVKMISKDDLANVFDVDRVKELTTAFNELSAVEKLKNLKKDDIVIVSSKSKKKKKSKFKVFLWIFLIIAAICGIAYLLLQYFRPEYEDEFMDDIDDEFYDDDDELFDDDDDPSDVTAEADEVAK